MNKNICPNCGEYYPHNHSGDVNKLVWRDPFGVLPPTEAEVSANLAPKPPERLLPALKIVA